MYSNKNRVYIIISILVLIFTTAFMVVVLSRMGTTTDTDVVYGGQPENGYPSAGFLVSYKENAKYQICGNIVLSANRIITAAHCIDEQTETYIGTGDFRLNKGLNIRVSTVRTLENWNGKDSGNDLALLELAKDIEFDKEYATVVEPKLGCNYTVVAYGRTDNESYFGADRPRNSIDVCIKKIDDRIFTLQGVLGGICFGDSGSPIFVKGTNKVVGVISAIIVPKESNEQVCRLENLAIATRLDKNLEFIYGNAPIENIEAKCGESCRYNRCSDGLTCSPVTLLCMVEGQADCKVERNQLCSPKNDLLCEDGLVCVEGKCDSEPNLITQQETVQLIFGVLSNPLQEKNFPIVLWVIIGSSTFAIVAQSLSNIRRNKIS